jgi:hypothetical protein
MRLDWLTQWLVTHLTEVRDQPATPIPVKAEEMSKELLIKWLTDEAEWWLSVSQTRGLSLSQRTMRIAVSRFYDDRALALLNTEPSHSVTDDESEEEAKT